MNRRNLNKLLAASPLVLAAPIVEACSACQTGKLQTGCKDTLKRIKELKSQGDRVNLILRHKDLRPNRRHIPIHQLKPTDFSSDAIELFNLADSIEFINRCNQRRFFKIHLTPLASRACRNIPIS